MCLGKVNTFAVSVIFIEPAKCSNRTLCRGISKEAAGSCKVEHDGDFGEVGEEVWLKDLKVV